MFEVAGGHFCLVDGTFGPMANYLFKVLYQALVNGQNLFDVAEECLNIFRSERALVRVSLLLSGLFKNMLCVQNKCIHVDKLSLVVSVNHGIAVCNIHGVVDISTLEMFSLIPLSKAFQCLYVNQICKH